jgi:hypothetical protein
VNGLRLASTGRALVYLKLGRFAEGLDYDLALRQNPQAAGSLYGRGIAKKRLGDNAGSKIDMGLAIALDRNVVITYARRGITP